MASVTSSTAPSDEPACRGDATIRGDAAAGRTRNWVALVDCESFYASCEAVFDPALRGKPVVVLSNNDGCVVALNRAAKQLGVEMGAPWFQISAWASLAGVTARSSNYELYGSMSARVMQIIGQFSAWQEVYSVDESFIGLRGSVAEVTEVGRQIRQRVLQYTGVPVRVSIAETKTLAKIASIGAKANLALGGVCHLRAYSPQQVERILDSIEVSSIWGVGRRLTKRLNGMGIFTARELRDSDHARIRKKFGVVLARTVLELRGISCIPLEVGPLSTHKEQLIFSRSFSKPVRGVAELEQVLSIYAQKVSSRLRAQGSTATQVSAWAATAHYREAYESAHASAALPWPSDNPMLIAKAAGALLRRINPQAPYARAGVILTGLQPKQGYSPLRVFELPHEEREVGKTLDAITAKLGPGSIGIGRGGLKQPPEWNMRRNLLSKRALTVWEEVPTVYAGTHKMQRAGRR